MSEERHEGDERTEDLELDADEAKRIVGGAPTVPDVSKTPPTPPTPPGVLSRTRTRARFDQPQGALDLDPAGAGSHRGRRRSRGP